VRTRGKICVLWDVPVTVSSRRFKRGLLIGLGEYLVSFCAVHLLGKRPVLGDER